MEKIRVKLLNPEARVPTYGSAGAAGADLYACLADPVTIAPGESKAVPTGVAIEIPEGYAGFIFARSSMGTKQDLAPANKVGVIDSDYRGELRVVLHNHGGQLRQILPGDRVAQLVILPVATPGFCCAETLSGTERGDGGFGSTGR